MDSRLDMPTASEANLLQRFRDSGKSISLSDFSSDDRAIVKSLRTHKWLSAVIRSDNSFAFAINDYGKAALIRYQDHLDQIAEEIARQEEQRKADEQATNARWRKDASRSWVQFWLGILFGAIGFVCGVLVEHRFAIIELLFSVFV